MSSSEIWVLFGPFQWIQEWSSVWVWWSGTGLVSKNRVMIVGGEVQMGEAAHSQGI